MKYIVEKIPMPDTRDRMGPKQRVLAMRSLGPNECITLDLTGEEKPERVRVVWSVSAYRYDVKIRSRMSHEPSGRILLRIWRVSEDQ
jgi:hypothetical protein